MIHTQDQILEKELQEVQKQLADTEADIKKNWWSDKNSLLRLKERHEKMMKISQIKEQIPQLLKAHQDTYNLCLTQRICPADGEELKEEDGKLKCICKKVYDIPVVEEVKE